MSDSFDKETLVSLIDLTSLNESDTQESILALCDKATTPLGTVASVCIYPQFVAFAKQQLVNTTIKIATVANFPTGSAEINTVVTDIDKAIANGADEIDIVMPYHHYFTGSQHAVLMFLKQCRDVCVDKTMKVILETGELKQVPLIKAASEDAINAGADFIKTSTGKTPTGATPKAANAMLTTIKQINPAVGFKASGGIRSYEQAKQYLTLTANIMGTDWINAQHVRFGASQLLDDLILQ